MDILGIPLSFPDADGSKTDVTSKKKKKKKLTAKQLKKLQMKLQEEARIQALMAKQKYLEMTKERVQREWEVNQAKKLVYEEELERRIEDFKRTFEKLDEIEEKWAEFLAEKRKVEEWNRYMNCNGLPDPMVMPQLNTYKFVWIELENESSIGYCMRKTDEVMQLLSGLDEVINYPWPECTPNMINSWKTLRNDLRNLLQNQIDKTAYKLFRRIETDMEPIDVTTSEYYCQCKYFTMHLWAELITPIPSSRAVEVRRPLKVRLKPADLTIIIPVNLLDVHKVIRVMLMNYDHWSDRCQSYDTPPLPVNDQKDMLQLTIDEFERRKEIVVFREELERLMKRKIANIPPQPSLSQELFAWESEPQRVLSDEIAFREAGEEDMWQESAKINLREFELNFRERQLLGGIIALEILHQPPQPKYLRFKHDVTLLVDPPTLQPVDYLVKYPPLRPVPPEEELEEEQEEREINLEEEYQILKEKEKRKLISVELDLPDTVYWFETPQIAVWDGEGEYWSSEHIHDVLFGEEETRMIFKTGRLGLFGLHVNRFCNMPYEDWRLEGTETEAVLFYLKAAKITMTFKIQDDKVCLVSLEDFPKKPMPGLLNTFHTPGKLAQMMKSFGINVFPERDAGCYMPDLKPKHVVFEKYLYQIWGLFSSSFCFQFSKFNCDRGRRKAVFQLRETYDEYETEFCLAETSPSSAYILDITEESEAYSSTAAPDMKTTTDFYNLIMSNCTNEAKRKTDSISFVLVQTVRDFLGYVRPLSFS